MWTPQIVPPSEPTTPTPGGYLAAVHARWLATEPQRRHRELHGSLLFCDVSGFTRLSERLAARGPVGAEELTEVVNAVFDGMLADCHRSGGDVLKFGGDALLVLFDGPEHAERAALTAWRIQRGMRPFARLKTEVGTVALRVSCGVASGRIQLVLAGDAPRELLVCGPVATAVCALEGDAEAGQVRVDAATAAALGPGAVADGLLAAEPVVHLLAEPPAPPDQAPPLGLPGHLHAHVPGEGEHRTVNVAFVQVCDTDVLLATRGLDVLTDALDEVLGTVEEACDRHGVTFVSTDVDRNAAKVMLATGAPVATGHDEDAMLHALRSLTGVPLPLPVRCGVNRGRAFTVDVGVAHRRTWTVMGDATNLAARVMGRADVGTVLAHTGVLDHARELYARDPIAPFQAKGKSQPVHAAVVGAPHGVRPRRPEDDDPLVGRDRELQVLRRALAAVRRGERGQAIELVGEAGLGKTRLVEALLADVRDARVIALAGGPYGRFSPYLALRAPLRALVGAAAGASDADAERALRDAVARARPDLEPWLPLLGVALGLELAETAQTAQLDAEFRRARLHAAVSDLIDALLGERPALIVVEDAHWLDEASSDLVASVTRRLSRRPRMVLTTRRPGTEGFVLPALGPAAERLELRPLDPQAARLLVLDGGAAGGAALTPDVQAELLTRGAGNPLFLRELLAAAHAGDDVAELPDSVEGLVAARIDTLPREDRAVVRQAAVLGVHVQVDLLGRLLGWSPFVARSTVRRLSAFFEEEGPGLVRFRHALLRDAAYAALPYRRRRELHGRVADLIAQAGDAADEETELLAIHEHAAGRWDRAWRFSVAAGERALRRAAPVEAAGFLRRALDAARHLPELDRRERARVAERLAHAALLAGRPDEASAGYRLARRAVHDDRLALAELHRREGWLRERSRHYGQALRWWNRGLALLDEALADPRPTDLGWADAGRISPRGIPLGATATPGRPVATAAVPAADPLGHALERDRTFAEVRGRLQLACGVARLRQGRLKDCVPLLESAASAAAALEDRATQAHAYYLLDWALTDLGDPEAHRYRDLALPIFEELEDWDGCARVLNNLGIDAYYEGRWDEAVALYERAREANQRVGDVVQTATLENNIAEVRLDQGRLTEAEELLRSARATWRGSSFKLGEGLATSNLGRLATRCGDVDGARELLERARTLLEAIDARAEALEVEAREAERLLHARDHDAALAAAGAIRRRAKRLGAAPALLAGLQRIAAFAKAQAGDADAARERLHEALAFAQSVDAAYEEALALQALARLGELECAAAADAILARLGVVASPAVPL